MTAGQLLREAVIRLINGGIDEPEANAGWLLAAALKKNRLDIISSPQIPVSAEEQDIFESYMRQKEEGLPLAYILGTQEFIDITLKVDRRVLVPRPETEEMAELAAEFLKNRIQYMNRDHTCGTVNILDYGVGSGAIGLWLLSKFPSARLAAAEKSPEAMECARENAVNLGLADRIDFILTCTPESVAGSFDLIVSNPPYIPSGIIPGLSPEVLSEPHVALDGGTDGLSVARLVLKEAGRLLLPGGGLFMELSGGDPERLQREIIPGIWENTAAEQDFSGQKRFFTAVRAGNICQAE